jgi:hypothetical protein
VLGLTARRDVIVSHLLHRRRKGIVVGGKGNGRKGKG